LRHTSLQSFTEEKQNPSNGAAPTVRINVATVEMALEIDPDRSGGEVPQATPTTSEEKTYEDSD
jgi:hypothetical protein